MRRVAVLSTVAAVFAAPAFALSFVDIDTDGDSLITFTEMSETYPDLTEDLFAEVDTSEDEFVDESELTAALEAGLIEEPEL